MSKVKVLYLVGSSGFGGVETFIQSSAKFHNTNKVQPYYFLLNKGPLADQLSHHAKNVFFSNVKFRLRDPFSFLLLVRQISELVTREKIQIIHSSMAYMAIPGAFASAVSGVDHVWFQHGPIGGWMDRIAANLVYKRILFNSEFTKKSQLALHFLRKKSIDQRSKIVYLGTEIPKEIPHVPTGEKLRFVMLARAQSWKGPDLVIKAASILVKEFQNFHIDLYLAGEQDSYFRSLSESASFLKNVLTLHPPTTNTALAYQSADVLINASRTPEPFGLTLIEAMSFGVIPIAPNAGGPLEIIEDAKSGLFFESGNAEDLAEKMKHLLKSPQLLNSMRRIVRAKAIDSFSVSKMVDQLEAIYFEMMSSNR